MTTKNQNMELWNSVCETDPRHTKKVNQRGGFTAINAQYQLRRATEAFGPIGQGWGFDVVHSIATVKDGAVTLAVADVTIWHGTRDQSFGPIRAMNPLVDEKARLDDDAAKKATTDAVTKALSQIGISADVFLGQYDDNKYLNGIAAKYGGEDAPIVPADPPARGRTNGGASNGAADPGF